MLPKSEYFFLPQAAWSIFATSTPFSVPHVAQVLVQRRIPSAQAYTWEMQILHPVFDPLFLKMPVLW